MFSLSKLAGGVIAALILACFFMIIPAGADGNSAWLAPSPLGIDKVADLNSIPAEQSNNLDCYFDRGGICSYVTPYGLADSTGMVKLNNSPRYSPVTGHVDERQHFFAIPNSNEVITYTTDPVHGAYAYFNYDFLSSIELVQDPAGFYYHMLKPPDATLTDQNGHKLAIDLTSISFSQNSEWMIVSAPNMAMLRVNLRTFEALPFAPGFSYDIGLSPNPITAITNDGRYAVFASKDFNKFAIYDLNTCGAAPSTISGPVSCQSRDLQAYMSGQISGFTVPSGLRFISDDSLSFFTKYTDNGIVKTAKFILSDINGPIHQQDYLALGDSYISGEGAYKYLPGTDTPNNQCHVSSVSYPLLIGSQLNYNSFHSVACSGATTEDVSNSASSYIGQAIPKQTKQQRTNNIPGILAGFQPGYIDQLDFVQQYQPKAITLSIGGNDIGFSARLQSCLATGTCYSTYEDRLEFVREVNQAFPKLVDTYLKIKNTEARDARIYVIGYPQIAKAGGDCGLNVHMNEAELEFAQQAIDYLDTIIKSAAAKAGVYYVDTQDALNGHRLCEARPGSVAVNGVTAGNDYPDWLNGPIGRESYHPNDFGHLLLENRVLAATRNLTQPMPDSDPAAAPPPETGLSILDAPHSGRAVSVTEYDSKLTTDFAYKGTAVNVSITGATHSLSPNSNLQATLHSDPIDLGTFKTDTAGNIASSLVLPPNAPAGYHSLHFHGTDINGQPIDIFKTIYIAATADDKDGNGTIDSTQKCPGLNDSGTDSDQDGIDDSCDASIGLPTASTASIGISASLSSGNRNILISAAPVSSSAPENKSLSQSPKVLADTINKNTSQSKTITKDSLRIPGNYYAMAGLSFLGFTTLGYFFRQR